MMMRDGGQPQRSPQLEPSGYGRGLGSSFASGQNMQNSASPMSMLYHGANAALGHNAVSSSPVVSGDPMGDGQQKRRFVWSPELQTAIIPLHRIEGLLPSTCTNNQKQPTWPCQLQSPQVHMCWTPPQHQSPHTLDTMHCGLQPPQTPPKGSM